jgi:NADH pyrophosphatase NudC (nudix superfamily)
MGDPKYNFQYCQKIVLFSKDWQSVFLAKRHGEAEYDEAFSFIGGKMETGDRSILEGLRREKGEEVGEAVRVRVYLGATQNFLYYKQDGSAMILPHYLAQYVGGDIRLNLEEYSECRWVPIGELSTFEPKIENIPACVSWAQKLLKFAEAQDFTEI